MKIGRIPYTRRNEQHGLIQPQAVSQECFLNHISAILHAPRVTECYSSYPAQTRFKTHMAEYTPQKEPHTPPRHPAASELRSSHHEEAGRLPPAQKGVQELCSIAGEIYTSKLVPFASSWRPSAPYQNTEND